MSEVIFLAASIQFDLNTHLWFIFIFVMQVRAISKKLLFSTQINYNESSLLYSVSKNYPEMSYNNNGGEYNKQIS